MEVILLEKVTNLGVLGDRVRVRPGYGRNYLVPQGKAVPATEDNIAAFEKRRAELEKAQADALAAAQARADALNGLVVTIARKTADEGRLFGSVGPGDVAEAITAAAMEVGKHEVRLGDGPLRQAGDHPVTVHLHPEVEAEVTVQVVPES